MMEFSIDSLHKMEMDLNAALNMIMKTSKVDTVENLNHTALMKWNKDPLADWVEKLSKLLSDNIGLCKTAASKIDKLQSEQIASQSKLIAIQQDKLDAVQDTVKTEMKSWSDIVKKNCDTTPSVKIVKRAVKSVVDESDRSKSFIIYGSQDNENDYPSDTVDGLFMTLDEEEKHQVLSTRRLGAFKKESCRPIKVTLASSDSVKQVLSKAKLLKTLGDNFKQWRNVYLAPDRNREERLVHKKLVAEMKQRITTEANKHHFIRGGVIISVERK